MMRVATLLLLLACSVSAGEYARLAKRLVECNRFEAPQVAKELRAAGPAAFEDVVVYLSDKSIFIRRRVADALTDLAANPDDVDRHGKVLFQALRETDDLIGTAAVHALSQGGSPTQTRLFGLAGRDTLEGRRAAAAVARGKPIEPLRAALGDDADEQRARLLWIVARIGAPARPLTKQIAAHLDSKDAAVRAGAFVAAAAVAPTRAESAALLVRGLADPVPSVRAAAARALPTAMPAVPTAILDSKLLGTHEAERGLAAIGAAAVPTLQARLKDAGATLALLRALGSIENAPVSKEAFEIAAQAAASKNPAMRRASCRFIATVKLDSRQRESHCRKLCKDPDAGVRAWAWAGLLRCGKDRKAATEALLDGVRKDATAETIEAALPLLHRHPALSSRLAKVARGGDDAAAAAVRALARIWRSYRPGAAILRRERIERLPRDVQRAITEGCRWLLRCQPRDGLWRSAAYHGHKSCSIGVTALALMALSTHDPDPARRALAVDALAGSQDEHGTLGSVKSDQFLIEHALATAALADAALLEAEPRRFDELARAANALVEWRNRGSCWRYEPRGGENDTFNTVWVAYAIWIARHAGADVSMGHEPFVVEWIDRMTGTREGVVGYNVRRGGPSRPIGRDSLITEVPFEKGSPKYTGSYAPTAAALWARAFLADERWDSKLSRSQWKIVVLPDPEWNPKRAERIDLCYWQLSAYAANWHDAGGARIPKLDKWLATMRDALVSGQNPDGSWDPIGAWGAQGGRVYSTAMGVLALAGTELFSADVMRGERAMPRPYRTARQALRDAAKSSNAAAAFEAAFTRR